MSRRRRVTAIASVVAIAAAGTIAVVRGPDLWHRYGDRLFSSERCTVVVDGDSRSLTAEQADNAALIVAVGIARDLPDKAETIALAVALQESDLRNLEVGDRDSLGLFQQRPSQGWGTPEQILDPYHATNAFYDALISVDGWDGMTVAEAAQAVQRSGFPDAYSNHEDAALLWQRALAGTGGTQAVTCSLATDTPAGDAEATFAARVHADFGPATPLTFAPEKDGVVQVVLDLPDTRSRDAFASWAVSVASGFPIERVSWCGGSWSRRTATWETDAGNEGCASARLTVDVRVA